MKGTPRKSLWSFIALGLSLLIFLTLPGSSCKKKSHLEDILTSQIRKHLQKRLTKVEIPPQVCAGDEDAE
jgi:hypothetical protein